MKLLLNMKTALKKYLAVCSLVFFHSLAWAQEKKVDIELDVDKETTTWYTQPWMWAIGAAVFIIIIVALMRGKSKD